MASTRHVMPAGLRLAGAFLLAGSTLAVVVVVLVGWQGLAHPWILVGDTIVSTLVGGMVILADRTGRRVPVALQQVIAILGVGLISGTSFAIGGTEGAVFACSYTFALAITAMHYSLRDVLGVLGIVAVMYAAVVVASDGTLAQWVLVIGVTASSGLLVGRFHRHVRQLTSQLQHLESWRAMLMSSLAHDLRSPLGMADSTLQLLERRAEDLTDDQRRQLLGAARRHQQRALQLTHDLLDHERVHADALELELRPTVLSDAVEAACEHVLVDVDVTVPVELVVDADPGRLQQILVNLISNAAKYGTGPIEVGATRRNDVVDCWVRDHGPGLPPEHSRGTFGRFAAGEAADSVGLGLWIIDRLVRAHGGELAYDDADPGARFTWTLQASTHPLTSARGG